ncbi:MAG: aldehyde ferredoxin oxidoreductase C-terminal domain-containing protein, partial [Anaerolineae bacterium]|nr:aldehyde ferredoxin oxidoreductase C-terminal domain-containing protein [Anaerolineae bacterium]
DNYPVARSAVTGSDHPRVDGPEYETAIGFSALVGSSDLEAAALAGHLCNLHGLDTISCASTIGLCYYLYNEGIIAADDVDGLALPWGDPQPMLQLVEMIAHRQGIGDLLAEGADATAQHFGVPDLAVTVKGLESAFHDPRAFSGQALVYATASRGADHMAGDYYELIRGREVPELGLELLERHAEDRHMVETAARLMDFRSFTNAAIICHFEDVSAENLLGMLRAITGWDVGYDDILLLGERITNFKRLLNFRLGATRADDRLPKMFLQQIEAGGTEGYVPDFEALLAMLYDVRGWDPVTGLPRADKLESLGLLELAGSFAS